MSSFVDRLLDRLADKVAHRVVELNAAKHYGTTITVQQANIDALTAASKKQLDELGHAIGRMRIS